MAENNTYEDARNQRLHENNRKLQELGIEKISKTLTQLTNSDKKSQQSFPKPKSKNVVNIVEPRRSSRARNMVISYRDDVDMDLPPLRKRSMSGSSTWASYLARPIEEVKTASYEERVQALKAAEQLQSGLQSGFPCFVKSMVRSHVYSCFWLGLPRQFCQEHLPKIVTDMVLEDENGREYDAIFIGQKTGLSGGWRAFALDHKLDDGDALVFELVEPKRFKIYAMKASSVSRQAHESNVIDEEEFTHSPKKTTKKRKKPDLQANDAHKNKQISSPEELLLENGTEGRGLKEAEPSGTNGFTCKKLRKRGKSAYDPESEKVVLVAKSGKCASLRPRKKPAPKLFRKKT